MVPLVRKTYAQVGKAPPAKGAKGSSALCEIWSRLRLGRHYDWIERGVFADIFQALGSQADLEWLSIDSTIVRAHQHAAGARREKGGLMPKVWAAPAAD